MKEPGRLDTHLLPPCSRPRASRTQDSASGLPRASAPAGRPPPPTWASQGQRYLLGREAVAPRNASCSSTDQTPVSQTRRLRTAEGETAWSRSPRETGCQSGLQPLTTGQRSGLPWAPRLATRPPPENARGALPEVTPPSALPAHTLREGGRPAANPFCFSESGAWSPRPLPQPGSGRAFAGV